MHHPSGDCTKAGIRALQPTVWKQELNRVQGEQGKGWEHRHLGRMEILLGGLRIIRGG